MQQLLEKKDDMSSQYDVCTTLGKLSVFLPYLSHL